MFRSSAILVLFAVSAALGQSAPSPATQSHPSFDPAAAVPADALMYFELSRPDQQFEAFLTLLQRGGIPDPLQFVQSVVAARGPTTSPALPGVAMLLHPSAIQELRKSEGVSLAILDLPAGGTSRRAPFLLVLRFGGSETLRGFVRLMLAGLASSVQANGGWTLHQLRDGLEAGLLNQAVVMGWPQRRVAAAIERASSGGASLLGVPGFREQSSHVRDEGGLLAFIQWPRLMEAIRRSSAEKLKKFDRADMILSLSDIEAMWGHAVLGAETVSARVLVDWKTGKGAAYELVRSRPLDRTILEYVPADSLGFLALSPGECDTRYDSLVEVLSAARGDGDAKENEEAVREELAAAGKKWGVNLRELVQAADTIAIGMLPPDVPSIARREAPATTQPTRTPAPTMRQILRASLFAVARVSDAEAFDRGLERLAQFMPPGAAEGTPVVIERAPAAGGERRTYRRGDDAGLHVIRQGSIYVVAGRPEVADAALAAHEGRVAHMLHGRNTQPVLAGVPAEASKLLLVRVDLVLNTILARRTLEWGMPPGAMLYAPVPSMKPAVAYTLEEDSRLELAARVHDMPILARTLLQVVPRPPRVLPQRQPATRRR